MSDKTPLILVESTEGVSHYDAYRDTENSPADTDCDKKLHPLCPSFRLRICFIASFSYGIGFASQALVAASLFLMIRPNNDITTNVTAVALPASSSGSREEFMSTTSETTRALLNTSSVDSQDEWHFNWSKSQYAWLVSSYFIGYYVMQLPAGWLTGRFGGYKLVLICYTTLIGLNALSIWIPRYGTQWLSILLVTSGIINAFTMPAVLAVIARWSPPNESSVLTALVCSGGSVGNGYTYLISAITSQIDLIGGWPFNFVIMATTQLIGLLLWTTFVTNVPEENKFVKQSEVIYIRNRFLAHGTKHKGIRSHKTPWFKILTSRHVYACCASMFGTAWVSYCYVSVFPSYLADVRHMETSAVSLLSGVPFFINPFLSFVVSRVVDRLREKQTFSTTVLRKSVDAIGKWICGGLLLASSFLPNNYTVLFVALYGLSINIMMGFQGSVWAVNVAELCPHYVGVVTTVVMIFGLPVSFITPPLYDAITPNNSEEEWHMGFVLTFGVLAATSVFYIIFASSREQHWDEQEDCSQDPLLNCE